MKTLPDSRPKAAAMLAVLVGAALAQGAHAQNEPPPPLTPVSPALATFPDELKQQIKYVFILYPENRSFDGLYGSIPG